MSPLEILFKLTQLTHEHMVSLFFLVISFLYGKTMLYNKWVCHVFSWVVYNDSLTKFTVKT